MKTLIKEQLEDECKLSKGTVIILAPHPDDETLGCGGTIAKKVNDGYRVLIVIMTDGRHSFTLVEDVDSDLKPQELKEMRKNEVKTAARILGVPEENLCFLEFEDGSLEHNEKEAREKIISILRRNPPTEVYYTSEKDFNPDHRATNRIAGGAVKKLGFHILQYEYSVTQTYARVGPLIDSLLNVFRRNLVSVDISKFVDLKKRAIKEFKSQTTLLSSKQRKPSLSSRTIERHLKNKEIFYVRKQKRNFDARTY